MHEMVELNPIAENYELSPASIMNVVHYASDTGLFQHTAAITPDLVIKGIKREYKKETIPELLLLYL